MVYGSTYSELVLVRLECRPTKNSLYRKPHDNIQTSWSGQKIGGFISRSILLYCTSIWFLMKYYKFIQSKALEHT